MKKKWYITLDHFLTLRPHPFQREIWKMNRIAVNRKHDYLVNDCIQDTLEDVMVDPTIEK